MELIEQGYVVKYRGPHNHDSSEVFLKVKAIKVPNLSAINKIYMNIDTSEV